MVSCHFLSEMSIYIYRHISIVCQDLFIMRLEKLNHFRDPVRQRLLRSQSLSVCKFGQQPQHIRILLFYCFLLPVSVRLLQIFKSFFRPVPERLLLFRKLIQLVRLFNYFAGSRQCRKFLRISRNGDSTQLLPSFSFFLISSQFTSTCSAFSASAVPNTCG